MANSRVDPLTKSERSALMAKVRGKGNASTELRAAMALIRAHISGWKRHPKDIPHKPDFYFPRAKLLLFVDGCFWHACPTCKRRIPRSRPSFWKAKIQGNRTRDVRVRTKLRRMGYRVLRVWEHELR